MLVMDAYIKLPPLLSGLAHDAVTDKMQERLDNNGQLIKAAVEKIE